MKILDFFQRSYVINLPERTDRLAGAKKELQKLGLSFQSGKVERFPGIRAKELNGFPSLGAHGCFLSHLHVLQQARSEGLRNVLIFEDDLLIRQPFMAVEASLLEQLSQEPWGIVHLGFKTPLPGQFPVRLTTFDEPLTQMTCYGVNGIIFDRLIEFLETVMQRPSGHPEGGPMHVDGAYNVFRQQNPDVLALKTTSVLISQRSSRSDISPNAWYDKIPVIRSMTSYMREMKTALNS